MAYVSRVALSTRLASRALVPIVNRSKVQRSFLHSSPANMSQHPIATLQVRESIEIEFAIADIS